MRRWPSSWRDPRLVGALIVGVTAVVGMFAERSAYAWDDRRDWVPDLLVGMVFAAAAAYALPRRAGTAWLLAATGMAWFVGTFDASFAYLHRGTLVHLLMAYAGWRVRGRLLVAATIVGYVAACVTAVWNDASASVVLALVLVATAMLSAAHASGRARIERRTAALATTMFGTAVIAAAVLTSPRFVDPMVVVYEAALVAIAVLLAARLTTLDTAGVVDVVVELGDSPSGTLREALSGVLGDPTVEIGYWSSNATYTDEHGHPVAIPSVASARAATFVERDSRPFAALVHDASVVDSPAIAEAVATATRLSAANAALVEEVHAQVAAVEASRRRLVLAADRERRRLEVRLHDGPAGRIASLASHLAELPETDDGHLRRAATHLELTIVELDDIARGLHPRELEGGLSHTLTGVAARCPVPVGVSCAAEGPIPDEIAVATYYVCTEALANITKHAAATRAAISVTSETHSIRVRVSDDGAGGANITSGSGLRGVADRVEALGGTFDIDSPPGGPTVLMAELPTRRT